MVVFVFWKSKQSDVTCPESPGEEGIEPAQFFSLCHSHFTESLDFKRVACEGTVEVNLLLWLC